jgi:hypothetical protein
MPGHKRPKRGCGHSGVKRNSLHFRAILRNVAHDSAVVRATDTSQSVLYCLSIHGRASMQALPCSIMASVASDLLTCS